MKNDNCTDHDAAILACEPNELRVMKLRWLRSERGVDVEEMEAARADYRQELKEWVKRTDSAAMDDIIHHAGLDPVV